MPSPQAHLFNTMVRIYIRRRRWGKDERAVARRARRLFGSLPVYQWLRTRGLRVSEVQKGKVCGEWLAPENVDEGAILYLHGGGYVSCSAATHRPITAALARLSRLRVFSLNYRLAPEHRFPAALDDATAAYRWLLEQGLTARSLAFAGDSAGGGLVLATLLRVRDEGLPLPACAVCFSAWTDLAGTGASLRANDGLCAMFHAENIAEFASVYLGDGSPLDPYASPAFADLKGLPPILLQVGSSEVLLDDSRRVHNKIQDAGGTSRLEVYDDVFHCWQMLDGIVPEARQALRQAAAFISEHISSTDDARLLSPV
ncbi:MAG TPA: alpha/beta hydrolase [Pyrinomonadaceae bacterium]|nr:alpha/beta hydrolase [Pyrinomonadaceae bacterium]